MAIVNYVLVYAVCTDVTDAEIHYGALHLHTAVKIEAPHLMKHCEWNDKYLKHICNSMRRITLNDIMSNKTSFKESSFTSLFRRLYLATRQIYGSQTVVKHTLPFVFHPDIIITHQLKTDLFDESGVLKENAAKDCTVIVLNTISQYANTSFTKLSRTQTHKLQLLEKLGFNVVTIPFFDIADLNVYKMSRKMRVKLNIPIRS